MPGYLPPLGRIPKLCRGKKPTAAQTHTWKRVLLVPAQALGNNVPEWQWPCSIHAPCWSCHRPFLPCSMPSSQLCCKGLGQPQSSRLSLWEYMMRPAQTSASSSQPACFTVLGPHPAPANQWPGKNRIGKGAMWDNPVVKDFSNSACDPTLGFMSLKTINPSLCWGGKVFFS